MNWNSISNLIVTLAPTFVGLAEKLFSHKPKSGPQKAQMALQLAQTAIVTALGLDPALFGASEQALITGINNDLVAYYNAKGWPTT
jgi:hypothetical protein